MKAALWYGPNDVRIEDVKEPVVEAGQVKIKVKWCGFCGTDIHEYLAGPIFIPGSDAHPTTGAVAPVILGHEFSGEVVELGEGVTHLAVGDAVTVEPLITCGECQYCREGNYHLCDGIAFHGLQDHGGGFAEYTTFRADRVKKLPEGVSYEMGALVEPLSVALHSVEMADFKAKQTAVVVGAGPIGLGVIECLKASGAKQVIAVELSETRKKFALRAGADIVLDPRECDVVAEVRKLTNGLGADCSFEVAGVQASLQTSIDVVKKQGNVVIVAIWEHDAEMSLVNLVMTEKKVVGVLCYNEDTFETVTRFMADGRIKAEGWVTKKIHLDDFVTEGFSALTGPEKEQHVKILVTPDRDLL